MIDNRILWNPYKTLLRMILFDITFFTDILMPILLPLFPPVIFRITVRPVFLGCKSGLAFLAEIFLHYVCNFLHFVDYEIRA